MATIERGPELHRGAIACFGYEQPAWAKVKYFEAGEIICKKVLGVPGDTVTTTNNENVICHERQCAPSGKILAVDSHGVPVEHVAFAGAAIPAHTYYLGSTRRPNSMDSRYFGLISAAKIVKTLVPILVEHDK